MRRRNPIPPKSAPWPKRKAALNELFARAGITTESEKGKILNAAWRVAKEGGVPRAMKQDHAQLAAFWLESAIKGLGKPWQKRNPGEGKAFADKEGGRFRVWFDRDQRSWPLGRAATKGQAEALARRAGFDRLIFLEPWNQGVIGGVRLNPSLLLINPASVAGITSWEREARAQLAQIIGKDAYKKRRMARGWDWKHEITEQGDVYSHEGGAYPLIRRGFVKPLIRGNPHQRRTARAKNPKYAMFSQWPFQKESQFKGYQTAKSAKQALAVFAPDARYAYQRRHTSRKYVKEGESWRSRRAGTHTITEASAPLGLRVSAVRMNPAVAALPPALRKYASSPGFMAAVARYKRFHGCMPETISWHKIKTGNPALDRAKKPVFMAALGYGPDETYSPLRGQRSNKAGSVWKHTYHKRPLKAVSGDGKTIFTLSRGHRVTDWIRG